MVEIIFTHTTLPGYYRSRKKNLYSMLKPLKVRYLVSSWVMWNNNRAYLLISRVFTSSLNRFQCGHGSPVMRLARSANQTTRNEAIIHKEPTTLSRKILEATTTVVAAAALLPTCFQHILTGKCFQIDLARLLFFYCSNMSSTGLHTLRTYTYYHQIDAAEAGLLGEKLFLWLW